MVRRGDLIVAVLWLVLALWVYSVAVDMPTLPRRPTQPGQWPAILALLMAALSVGLLVQLGLRWRASQKAPESPELDAQVPVFDPEKPVSEAESPADPAANEKPQPLIFFLSIVILAAYIWLLPRLGFWLMTPFLLLFYMLLLGLRRPVPLVVLTLVLSGVVVLVFSQVLAVPLPRGTGVFRDVSYWFY